MYWSILHRTILWELVKVFTMALLGITGLLLLAGIVAEASQQGLSPGQILAIIPLLIPSTLPYTIPATTLFACCIVYGRLAADNEILAIRAAGVNILRVLSPALLLGISMSCVTMGLYYYPIPYTHRILRTMAVSDAEEFLYAVLKREHQINHHKLPYAIWVRQVQGKKLIDAMFKRRDSKTNYESYDLIAFAKEADLQVDTAHQMVIVHMRGCTLWAPGGGQSDGKFEDRIFEVPLPPSAAADKQRPRPRDQTWQELLQCRRDLQSELEGFRTTIALATAEKLLNYPPKDLPQHVENLRTAERYTRIEIRSRDTELQMRPALAMGCFCFVMVGCPVGIWFSRSDYLSAFITCFLPIVFVYYPLMLCGTNLTKDGRFHPALTVWMADAVMILIGLVLWRRLLRN